MDQRPICQGTTQAWMELTGLDELIDQRPVYEGAVEAQIYLMLYGCDGSLDGGPREQN